MSSAAPSDPWGDFTQDPRTPQAAPLRASDRDRDVITGVLTEGYADGRLTREEFDDRSAAAAGAKTLGDLPALILDLVPQNPTAAGGSDLARATPDVLHQRAVQRWETQRRQALTGFVIPTVICWAIWVMIGLDRSGAFDPTFPWPAFVTLGTGAGLLRTVLNREAIILEEQHRLEKKQRKALETQQRREQPGS
jgi:Domain of unknown function (DUF1707)